MTYIPNKTTYILKKKTKSNDVYKNLKKTNKSKQTNDVETESEKRKEKQKQMTHRPNKKNPKRNDAYTE